jgi:hypothetical protein
MKKTAVVTIAAITIPLAWLIRAIEHERATDWEIQKGRRALRRAVRTKTNARRAMTHPTLGPISFLYGKPSYGIEHIKTGVHAKKTLYKGKPDGGKEWTGQIFDSIPLAIMRGKVVPDKEHDKTKIEYKNLRIILAKAQGTDESEWVLNAFPKVEGQKISTRQAVQKAKKAKPLKALPQDAQ